MLAGGPGVFAQTYWDLTGSTPGSAFVNGSYILPNLGSPYVSGSGVFNSFLRIQDNPNEEGFNVGTNPARMTDVKGGVSLQPNALTRPAAGSSIGTSWFTFALDINEDAGPGQLISLDEITIYGFSSNQDSNFAAQSTDAAKLNFLRTNGTYIWSSDGTNPGVSPSADTTVLLDYRTVSSGSGLADVLFVIPDSFFPTTIGGTTNYFLYFYAKMGYTGTYNGQPYTTSAGFEEFNTVSGLVINPPPVIPEPGTWAGGGVALVAAAGTLWHRRRRRSA